MEDVIEVNEEPASYILVQKEIREKGKGYFLLKKVQPPMTERVIKEGIRHLLEAGSEKIYFACTDESIKLSQTSFKVGEYEFKFYGEMDYMEKTFDSHDIGADEKDLLLERLTDKNCHRFKEIYNQCFFHVPNSETYTDENIKELLKSNMNNAMQVGLIFRGEDEIGMYEISFAKKVPEIAAIGIAEEERGKRWGFKALNLLLRTLGEGGFCTAGLIVSTANPQAYYLYKRVGFQKQYTQSRWYTLESVPKLSLQDRTVENDSAQS